MISELLSAFQVQGSDIEFANAQVWWLLPLPIFVYFFASSYREYSESVQIANLADLASETRHGEESGTNAKKKAYFLVSLIWLGLLASASQPEQIIFGEQKEVSVRDILLVLDISGSMAIRDMQGENGEPAGASRMQVMQQAVSEFIDKREYDNIGLIVFGSQALPLTPVSQDHSALQEQISEMVPGMAGPQTSIGDAMGVAIRTYRELAKNEKGKLPATDQERMMILLTDGLDTSSVLPPRVALRLAEKQNVVIHTIAFGDVKSEDASGSIDTQLLKDIASQTNGSYHQAAESLVSLQEVYEAIDKLAPKKMELIGLTERKALFTYPLLLSFALSCFLLIFSLFGRKKND